MDKVFLKPAVPELKVPIPGKNRFLAADGEEQELTIYWRRRIEDGDVVIVTQPKAATAPVVKPAADNKGD